MTDNAWKKEISGFSHGPIFLEWPGKGLVIGPNLQQEGQN